MVFVVKYTTLMNRITGKDSLTCSNGLFLSSLILTFILQVFFDFYRSDNFGLAMDMFILAIYAFVYFIDNNIEKDYWDIAKSKYNPNTIIMMPVLFSFRYSFYKRTRSMSILFIMLCIFQFGISIFSLSSRQYINFGSQINSAFFFCFVSMWYASHFFYHRIYDSSLYSRTKSKIKEKLDNRQKSISFSPVGV